MHRDGKATWAPLRVDAELPRDCFLRPAKADIGGSLGIGHKRRHVEAALLDSLTATEVW